MKSRYSLCAPVNGGIQFWLINDIEEMFAIVSISVHCPNAEQEAKRLFSQISQEVNRENRTPTDGCATLSVLR